jgi:uncharacterized protein YegL
MALTIVIPPEATSRKQVPVILLVDVSTSMDPVGIAQANQGIRDYIEEMKRNEETRESVTLSIITFSNVHRVLVDHQPIDSVTAPQLSAEGGTELDEGLKGLLTLVTRHEAKFKGGKEPLFVLITDGNPTCDEQQWRDQLRKINDATYIGKRRSGGWSGYRVLAGAGEQINDSVLEAFRHDKEKSQVIRLKDQANISEFFKHLKTLTVDVANEKPLSKIVSTGTQVIN